MSYFGKGGVLASTEVVEISGGYHVTIGFLSGKQTAECEAILQSGQKAKTRVTARARGRDAQEAEQATEMTLDYAAYRDARILRGVKDWDLDEEDGTKAPIDLAHIQMMPEKDRNTVFLAIETFNSPPSEDQHLN